MQTQDQRAEAVFARRMRQVREAAKMSQTRLAELLAERGIKIDPTSITRIEKGARGVRLEEAVAIAEALGVPLEELLLPGRSIIDQIRNLEGTIEEQEATRRLLEMTIPANRRLLEELKSRLAEQQGDSADGTR